MSCHVTRYRVPLFTSVRSEPEVSPATHDVLDHRPVPPAALLLIPHVRPEEERLDAWAVVTHVTTSCAQTDQAAH